MNNKNPTITDSHRSPTITDDDVKSLQEALKVWERQAANAIRDLQTRLTAAEAKIKTIIP